MRVTTLSAVVAFFVTATIATHESPSLASGTLLSDDRIQIRLEGDSSTRGRVELRYGDSGS